MDSSPHAEQSAPTSAASDARENTRDRTGERECFMGERALGWVTPSFCGAAKARPLTEARLLRGAVKSCRSPGSAFSPPVTLWYYAERYCATQRSCIRPQIALAAATEPASVGRIASSCKYPSRPANVERRSRKRQGAPLEEEHDGFHSVGRHSLQELARGRHGDPERPTRLGRWLRTGEQGVRAARVQERDAHRAFRARSLV